jgi:hypothetical protein
VKTWQLTVQGRRRSWAAFRARGSDEDAADWRADGLDIAEVVAEEPADDAVLGEVASLPQRWGMGGEVN